MASETEAIRLRKLATLRYLYRGVYEAAPGPWIACRLCGALYPDPRDLADCHKCPLEENR
jgi:hypothetical protein